MTGVMSLKVNLYFGPRGDVSGQLRVFQSIIRRLALGIDRDEKSYYKELTHTILESDK